MIFVTVGTHGDPMPRLIKALGELHADDLVVQYGSSPAPHTSVRAVGYMRFDEMLDCFEAADVVITHAGVGSILSATRAGHVPLVVPRSKRLGEHVDDHQIELTQALVERGAVRAVWNLEELAQAVASCPARRRRSPPAADLPVHGALREALRGEERREYRSLGHHDRRRGGKNRQ